MARSKQIFQDIEIGFAVCQVQMFQFGRLIQVEIVSLQFSKVTRVLLYLAYVGAVWTLVQKYLPLSSRQLLVIVWIDSRFNPLHEDRSKDFRVEPF